MPIPRGIEPCVARISEQNLLLEGDQPLVDVAEHFNEMTCTCNEDYDPVMVLMGTKNLIAGCVVAVGCPVLGGNIGAACTDAQRCTINNTITANRHCMGTWTNNDPKGCLPPANAMKHTPP